MKYSIKQSNFSNFDIFQVNRRPARAYFIPFDTQERLEQTDFRQERAASPRVQMLNGEWGFKYFPRCSQLPVELDTDAFAFDRVQVPSTWQHTGFEKPFYLNRRYQFPKKPPHIPTDIPVAVYRTMFSRPAGSGKTFLNFMGVCACCEVYLNGNFVGYSEGSHNRAEFDVTSFLGEENELVALVYKFSNGSYLECQDMYRENGIFRDVFLLSQPESHLEDFAVDTVRNGDGSYNFTVNALVANPKDVKLTAHFMGQSVTIPLEDGSGTLALNRLSVEEWSAETPRLYPLILSLCRGETLLECVRQEVGFRSIEIQGEVYLFNQKKIKMKGVNHHDSNPVTGYAVTPEDMERDIRLMKAYNVNTVRTSHYPKDPLFLQLCAHYGLYVVDEADIETHGFFNIEGEASGNRLSNSEAWKEHYLDRVMTMFYTDRNQPCVAMWSLGNESGGWKNQDACYEALKKRTTVPVHYEGVTKLKRNCYDIKSDMYTSHKTVAKIPTHEAGKGYIGQPYFLCEYAHAMGVGPGLLEQYWDAFYAGDNMLGGCIWEFCDHSAYCPDEKYQWTYGGDHEEFIHDGNFCVDGLFYPDRRPHTGALEMAHVYRPLRARYANGVLVLKNTNSFSSSKELKITYALLRDGKKVQCGEISEVAEPLEEIEIALPLETGGDCQLQLVYEDRKDGHFVASEEIALGEFETAPSFKKSKPQLRREEDVYCVTFSNGAAKFHKKTGALLSYAVDGKERVNQNPVYEKGLRGLWTSIMRAPNDNEINIKILWTVWGIFGGAYRSRLKSIRETEAGVEIVVKASVAWSAAFRMVICVNGEGQMKVSYRLTRKPFAASQLPKIGAALELDESLRQIRYFGRGGQENYPDLKGFAQTGIYRKTMDDFYEPYIRPQDNGNRCDVRWAELLDDQGAGLRIEADGAPFGLEVHRFTQEALRKATHLEEVPDQKAAIVEINGFVRGVGTNACGPLPDSQFLCQNPNQEYAFVLSPVSAE